MTEQTVAEKLAEARGALHRLRIGKASASISSGGRSVTYHAADITRLEAYVRELEQQAATTAGTPRRAVGFVF